MQALRSVAAALVVAGATATAALAAALVGWWLVAPSQTVVEVTRYPAAWLGGAVWIASLLGLGLPRGRARRSAAGALVAGAVLAVALVLGPGTVAALVEVQVHNRSAEALTGLRIVAGDAVHEVASLPPGGRWRIGLGADPSGRLRFSARDAAGDPISATSALVPGSADRFQIEVDDDGSVLLSTRSLHTGWPELADRVTARVAARLGL